MFGEENCKTMKKILLLLFGCIVINASAQQNARYGRGFAPYGLFRVFTVFADVVNDTVNCSFTWWNEGELPDIADEIFEHIVLGVPSKYVTKYFYEASFGSLTVLGDYYPYLVNIYPSDIMSCSPFSAVRRYLNSRPDSDTLTQSGYGFSVFDKWSHTSDTDYMQKSPTSDNKIDMINVIWRRNEVNFKTPWGGTSDVDYNDNNPIKRFNGINGHASICHEEPHKVFRHEFSHMLIGHNNYHTGGAGAGASGFFLSNIGGYSMLSSYNANLESYNGWDRWWLGWKHPSKEHYISAIDNHGNEVNTDLEYGEPLENNEFILRNFANYGDAIRIKLPYIKTLDDRVRNQYLWIENHQIKEHTIEYKEGKAKGIRFNIQIGNDNLESDLTSSMTNYYVPLSAFGNYDFDYVEFDTVEPDIHWFDAYTSDTMTNPFTGYHPIMMPAWDVNLDEALMDDKIQSKEYITVHRIYKDGVSACGHLPVFGNNYDAFTAGSSIGMGSNPPTTPLITYRTSRRERGTTQTNNPSNPETDDNRYIWLNGLRVDILEEYSNGNIKVRIVWNDYDIDNDVRWCGPIMLTENLYLKNGHTILLDYGLMPTRPNNPVLINGKKVFADPTVFTCRNGSYFKQETSSKVNVINQSVVVLESGSVYEIEDGAVLDIQATGSLVVKSGATLHVKGSGHVEVRDGGYICFENGANILLDNTLSVVNLHNGHTQGVNPVHQNISPHCYDASLTNYPFIGQGAINTYSGNIFIQRITYTNDAYETGITIRAGHHVTIQKRPGNVIIENGANVIFDSEDDATLEPGTEVKAGGSLIVR